MDLFGGNELPSPERSWTLADRMRPQSFDELVGQEHLIGEGKPLRRLIDEGKLSSMVFWGPPGSGKTTLANIIAAVSGMRFLSYSAVLSGISEIRKVIQQAEQALYRDGLRSILFIDEIHRFNKAQQDAFLPYVEKGTIILIGATTENPSFEIISPLLSRVTVFVLKPLTTEMVVSLLERALADTERGLGKLNLTVEEGVLEHIAELSSGDARFGLNILELAASAAKDGNITLALLSDILQRERLLYDKTGEEHYNLISALHKSLRDSDPDGALYWLVRMFESGEDRLYIARRLMRFAAEDVGLADPGALRLATAAKEAYHFLGSPEGEIALAELTLYLAAAPKSNSVYTALTKATQDVRAGHTEPVPMHLRNAPTKLMKKLGYGKGYKYAHSEKHHLTAQSHLPPELEGKRYYVPSEEGLETRIAARLAEIRKIIEEKKGQGSSD